MDLLLAVGLGLSIRPSILFAPESASDAKTVVRALLGAIGLVALPGLRDPLRMLPLLFFELVWKTVWLVAYAFAPWLRGPLNATTMQNAFECLAGIALMLVTTPPDYVDRNDVGAAGEPWRGVPIDRNRAVR